MMRSSWLFFLVVLISFSCGNKEEKKTQSTSVSFEIKTFRLESQGGCKTDTSKCASYTVHYPVFTTLSSAVQDSLFVKISKAVDMGNPETDTLSFEQAGKTFIANFEKTKKQFPDEAMGWSYRASVDVAIATDTLVSLVAHNVFYTGGAHGGYGTYFVNINPATGKSITLVDVLKPGFDEELRKAGEMAFRKALQMSDTTSYSEQGLEFENDKFQLNDNYGFNAEGITFVFNAYEVASYAAGSKEFVIPYEKIKNELK